MTTANYDVECLIKSGPIKAQRWSCYTLRIFISGVWHIPTFNQICTEIGHLALLVVDKAVGFMCHATAEAPCWGAGQSGIVRSQHSSEGGERRENYYSRIRLGNEDQGSSLVVSEFL